MNIFERSKMQVLGGFNSSNYVTERKWATASDGTQIPISIFYHKNLVKLDGSDPLLLYGYGSYEVIDDFVSRQLCISHFLIRAHVVPSTIFPLKGLCGTIQFWKKNNKVMGYCSNFICKILCKACICHRLF